MYMELAFVLVVLILIVFFGAAYLWYSSDSYKRKQYRGKYEQSTGDFDKAAKEALDVMRTIQRPTAEDNFMAGNVLEQNYLQGNLREAEPNIIGAIFTLYTNVLEDAQEQEHEPLVGLGFMVDHIDQFHNNILQARDDLVDMTYARLFGNAVVTNIPTIRRTTAAERKNKAVKDAKSTGNGSMAQVVDNYFDNSIQYTSNKQNVHDNKVGRNLRETYAKLKSTAIHDNEASLDEIRDFIIRKNPTRAQDALEVLDVIAAKAYITTFNDTEDNILAAVWDRSKHLRNSENSELMKEAVVDALIDSKENGHVVCINGRCARLLASPVLLDFDKTVGEAKTYEAYKNEIFENANKIIKNKAAEYKESPSEDKRRVGLSYEDPKIEVNETAEAEFKSEAKEKIISMINKYSDVLDTNEREVIANDCFAAI